MRTIYTGETIQVEPNQKYKGVSKADQAEMDKKMAELTAEQEKHFKENLGRKRLAGLDY